MPPSRRAASAALSVSALTLGLVACGGDSSEDDAAASAAPSATTSDTASAGSPDEEPTARVSTAPGAGSEVAPFLARLKDGFGDEGSVHVRMTMSGAASLSAEGDTTYGPDGSDLRLSLELGGRADDVTMVAVDDQVYLSMPGITPEGKFFQVPADSPALEGFNSSGLSPADSFAAFEAGLLKVEEKGQEEIDGESTDRFELHLDADRAMDAMGPAAGAQEEAAELPETLVYDVWLDSEDRMRRIEYAVSGAEVTMDMTDWGDVEPVEAPDEADVVEAPNMSGAG